MTYRRTMVTKPIGVVETQTFQRQAEKIWDEEERMALIDHVARNPETGVVVPGTGGVRKMRWGRAGSGKRGGARVIYFYFHEEAPLYLLLAYAKARAEDMSGDEKRAIAAAAAALKKRHSATRTEQ
jgi:hypothetical protein